MPVPELVEGPVPGCKMQGQRRISCPILARRYGWMCSFEVRLERLERLERFNDIGFNGLNINVHI